MCKGRVALSGYTAIIFPGQMFKSKNVLKFYVFSLTEHLLQVINIARGVRLMKQEVRVNCVYKLIDKMTLL